MYPLIILNLVCTGLSFYGKKGLKIAIWLLFIFLALRYNFGNDYKSYSEGFDFSFYELIAAEVEVGYAFLVSVFQFLNFKWLVAFLSGLFCWSLYRTIVRYVTPKWYWIVVFAIISNGDLIFTGASAIRQTTAMSIIFLSLPYLENKKLLVYLIMVALASSFHMSAMFFVILYPLLYVDMGKKLSVVIIAIFALLLATVLKDVLYVYIGDFTENSFEKYAGRYGRGASDAIVGGFFGIVIRVYFAALMLFSMYKNSNRMINIFILLSILSFVIFSMREQVMLQRYNMYFGYFICLVMPYILNRIKKEKVLCGIGFNSLLFVYLIWNISMAINFFLTANSSFEYHTIFSAI